MIDSPDMKSFSISSSAIQFPITYSPLHTQSPCYLVKTLIKSLTVTWHGNCMFNHLIGIHLNEFQNY